MVLAGFAQHGLMQGRIERFALHPHRRNPQLLEHIHELSVKALVAAMQALGFLGLGIELLASPIEVVDHRQDLAEGVAGDLEAQILLIAALALPEVVEISGDPHVLLAQGLVLQPQGSQFGLQLLQPGGGSGFSPEIRHGLSRHRIGGHFRGFRGRSNRIGAGQPGSLRE